MLYYIYIYIILGIIWAWYAHKQQMKYYPETTMDTKVLQIIINFLFFPVCSIIAIIRNKEYK